MQQDKTFLGTEPVGQLLRRLAIPTVIAQLVNMLYNIVDRIYIGHIPEVGSSALTGVGVCLPIILIVSAFACFTASGGAPRASIYMGRNDMDSAEKTLGGCFTLQIGISVVLTAALLLWGRKALLAFGASENTIDYAADYLHIYAFGTLFVELTLGMNAFITAQGFAKVGMYTVLIGAAANIVLDPIFIFALGMGVRGAALATVLSQGLSCAWVLVFLCGKKAFLRLRRENLFVSPKLILPCVALGLATFTMQASESVISVCFNASLLKYGGDIAVGAMTILTSVMQFAMLPLQGIGQGAQPITSYNFGAKNTDRVRETFRLLLKVCLIYSVSLWLLIELLPGLLGGTFTPDAAPIAFTARLTPKASGFAPFAVNSSPRSAASGATRLFVLLDTTRILTPRARILPSHSSTPASAAGFPCMERVLSMSRTSAFTPFSVRNFSSICSTLFSQNVGLNSIGFLRSGSR